MPDPRLELIGVTEGASEQAVLDALDGLEIILTLAPGRGTSREDAVGLVNLVNVGARVFPHWTIDVPDGVGVDLGVLGSGDLLDLLNDAAARVRPPASRAPDRQVEIRWGATPIGEGLALDAVGWSCSVGPEHLRLAMSDGPPVGALAAGSWAVGQILVGALGPLGMPGHRTRGFRWNLLTYQLNEAPATAATTAPTLPAFTNAGCGSVGSSLLYAALLAGIGGGPVDLVDPDGFTERNSLRYPIVREDLTSVIKVDWLADLSCRGGIDAREHATELAAYTNEFSEPPAIDLVVSSVDTLAGRRDATDLLAATTLNIGVSGLRLHISRHGFGPGGCAYCQYVDLSPPLSGAAVVAELVGLPVERIIAIEHGDGRITDDDAHAIAAGGRFGDIPQLAGQRLADLRRHAYAQASVATEDGDLRVSAPHVSAMAGVLGLAEALKHRDPSLESHRVASRLDLDLSGEPTGFVTTSPRDRSGRCLCHHGFRRRVWRDLHGTTGARTTADMPR